MSEQQLRTWEDDILDRLILAAGDNMHQDEFNQALHVIEDFRAKAAAHDRLRHERDALRAALTRATRIWPEVVRTTHGMAVECRFCGRRGAYCVPLEGASVTHAPECPVTLAGG